MKPTKNKLHKTLEDLLNLPLYSKNETSCSDKYLDKRWVGLMGLLQDYRSSEEAMKIINEAAYKSVLQLIENGQEYIALIDYPTAYCIHFDLSSYYDEIIKRARKRMLTKTGVDVTESLVLFISYLSNQKRDNSSD